MPIIKSAKKRVKQTAKATARNAQVKRGLRKAVLSLQVAIASGDKQKIKQAHSKVDGALDTATKKNLFHKNKSARKKRQIAQLVKTGDQQKAKAVKATTKKTATPKDTTQKVKPVAAKKVPKKKVVPKEQDK